MINQNWLSQVARGLIPGHSSILVSGDKPDVDMSVIEDDIWDLPITGRYPFPDDGTAPINTMSSSNAGDSMNLISIGLDINGDEVTEVVPMDGQNKVPLSTPLWRTNRIINKSQQSIVGEIYQYEDTDIVAGVPTDLSFVRGFISLGNNISLQSIFTIPNNKIGLIHYIYPFLSKNQTASVVLRIITRNFGEVQLSSVPISLSSTGSSFLPVTFPVPIKLNARTDIMERVVKSSDNNVGVGVNYNIIIIDQIN